MNENSKCVLSSLLLLIFLLLSGVGAVEGKTGVQWWFMGKVFFGWVASFFITCLTSAGIMAFCYYSPSAMAYSDIIVQNITVTGN